jgi:hypothetical protein
MVRRPWLRRTRLLAGAPTASASPSGISAGASTARGAAFPAVTFFGGGRTGLFGADAGSCSTLGDPMPGAW